MCRVASAESQALNTVWNPVPGCLTPGEVVAPWHHHGAPGQAVGFAVPRRLRQVVHWSRFIHLILPCASVQVHYIAKRGFYMVLQRPGTSLEGGSKAPDLPAGFLPLQSRGTSGLDCTTQELNTLNVRLAKAASDCLILTEQVGWPDQPHVYLWAASLQSQNVEVKVILYHCYVSISLCTAKPGCVNLYISFTAKVMLQQPVTNKMCRHRLMQPQPAGGAEHC